MRLTLTLIAMATILVLATGGCGGVSGGSYNANQSDPAGSDAGSKKVGRHLTVGIALVSGDDALNDGAKDGTELAKKAGADIEVRTASSKSPKDYAQTMISLSESGCDLVFALGPGQVEAVEAVAPKYPKVQFAVIDGVAKGANVRSIRFADAEGSYLAGYLAAIMTKTNKIGFMGAAEAFEVGYRAGAKSANPRVDIVSSPNPAKSDKPESAKTIADALYDAGADVVYQVGGNEAAQSAKEKGKFMIAAERDQDALAKGVVLTSMIEHVDIAIRQTIQDAAADRFTPGVKIIDLAHGGVGLSAMSFTKKTIGKDTLKKIEAQANLIKAGKLKPPATEEELVTYTAKLTPGPVRAGKGPGGSR